MKPLIAPESVEKALLFVAVIGPLAGAIVGVMIGAHERCARSKVIKGASIGAIGTLVYGMWHLYRAITNALGLDSVANLCVQIALFAAVGAILGYVMFGMWRFLRGPGINR